MKYDVRLNWEINSTCNLKCKYCFKGAHTDHIQREPIVIKKIIDCLNATNKIFKVAITGGGEPFLTPNIIDLCSELSQKHYLQISTNLTSSKIKEFAEIIKPSRVEEIVASAHIEEIERMGLKKIYIDNFLLLKRKGFNVNAVEVAYPGIANKALQYMKEYKKAGVNLQFTPFIGEYNKNIYPDSYTEEEINIFKLDSNILNSKNFHTKGRSCNAGYNSFVVKPDGSIFPCYYIRNKVGKIDENIKFSESLSRCPEPFCSCPVFVYDKNLYERALSEVNKVKYPIFGRICYIISNTIHNARNHQMIKNFVSKRY